jgi:hypothetical protein
MGASYRCEGYKKPATWQKAIAPAITVSARPLEHNTEATGHDRLLQTERSLALEINLTAIHASRSPVQQSIHKENSEFGSIAWLPNDNRSIRGDPSSVWPTGSCNQQPMSTYAALPLSRPGQRNWTIPSIHEVLQGTGDGSDIPFVSRSCRE